MVPYNSPKNNKNRLCSNCFLKNCFFHAKWLIFVNSDSKGNGASDQNTLHAQDSDRLCRLSLAHTHARERTHAHTANSLRWRVYDPSTCSIVRLQARLRVQSAHHKITGEAAGSRSGGSGGSDHRRRVLGGGAFADCSHLTGLNTKVWPRSLPCALPARLPPADEPLRECRRGSRRKTPRSVRSCGRGEAESRPGGGRERKTGRERWEEETKTRAHHDAQKRDRQLLKSENLSALEMAKANIEAV